jgi:hypothetical protein
MNKRKIIGIIILSFLFSTNIYAWWSIQLTIRDSTHYKLTSDAFSLLNTNDYHNLTDFAEDIIDWTAGTEDDKRAHGGDRSKNDGPYVDFWNKAYDQYKLGNIANGEDSAIYQISLMMHLIEDKAVPAHAYGCLRDVDS